MTPLSWQLRATGSPRYKLAVDFFVMSIPRSGATVEPLPATARCNLLFSRTLVRGNSLISAPMTPRLRSGHPSVPAVFKAAVSPSLLSRRHQQTARLSATPATAGTRLSRCKVAAPDSWTVISVAPSGDCRPRERRHTSPPCHTLGQCDTGANHPLTVLTTPPKRVCDKGIQAGCSLLSIR